jgi:hypothetical protein
MDELYLAVKSGKPHKAPGYDGICQEFFKVTWEEMKHDMLDILNQMHSNEIVLEQQKHGLLVCLPKTPTPNRPEDYRPLTLLNGDIKLLARIIANRLCPWLAEILQQSQHCGLQGNTVLEAVAAVREAVAYAEITNKAMCVLSLDFRAAFDNISHSYLFAMLKAYGFSEGFQSHVQSMYKGATSSVLINGHKSSPIPIRCSIRQGCPLSMQLFALCLNPLLCELDARLPGIKIGHNSKKTTMIAYADDVTILIMSPTDIQLIQEAIRNYQAASGATLNRAKSKAMAIGAWDISTHIMGIPYHTAITILGVQMHNTVSQSANNSWSAVTGRIRAQACDAYSRDLALDQRILYVHNFLLARAWYIVQIFPRPEECVRQIHTAISWYIWSGKIFKVPLSTLQRPKAQGGWGLIHIAAKSRALHLYRLRIQGQKPGTITAEWLRAWDLLKTSKNLPNRDRIPGSMEYLRIHITDSAYIAPLGQNESVKAYKRRMYDTMHTFLRESTETPAMQIT